MHEIIFRGKRIDNGEWVEGAYMPHYYSTRYGKVAAIFTNDDVLCKTYRFPVDPSTVGQYTGLEDKNGRRIFEGDIVDILTENEEIGVVEYEDGGFLVSADGFCVDFHANINGTDLDVIGNKWDNPEWLEVR